MRTTKKQFKCLVEEIERIGNEFNRYTLLNNEECLSFYRNLLSGINRTLETLFSIYLEQDYEWENEKDVLKRIILINSKTNKPIIEIELE